MPESSYARGMKWGCDAHVRMHGGSRIEGDSKCLVMPVWAGPKMFSDNSL